MKRSGTCTKCRSSRVVKVERVPDAGDYTGSGRGHFTGRTASIHVPRAILSRKDGVICGETEAYVCADCGWFEEYVADPAGVAWDEVEGVWARKG